jgi:hypothetical protein
MLRSKNAWSYTSTAHYVFIAWCLVKHKGNFAFTLYAEYYPHIEVQIHGEREQYVLQNRKKYRRNLPIRIITMLEIFWYSTNHA